MKKNLLKAMVALVLLPVIFTGCSKKFDSFESVGVYDGVEYPRFLSTDWGMSVDETFKALGVEKVEEKPLGTTSSDSSGVENVDEEQYNAESNQGKTTIYTANLTVGGNEIEADLYFTIDPDGTDLGLTTVTLAPSNQEVTDELSTMTKYGKYYTKSMYVIGTEKDALDQIRPQYEYSKQTVGQSDVVMSKDEWLESFRGYHMSTYLGEVQVFDDGWCRFIGYNAAVFKKILPDK